MVKLRKIHLQNLNTALKKCWRALVPIFELPGEMYLKWLYKGLNAVY
jgi:hypothetical protein